MAGLSLEIAEAKISAKITPDKIHITHAFMPLALRVPVRNT